MAITAPNIITRSEWGANSYRGTPTAQPRYEHLILHHAAGFHAQDRDAGKREIKKIQHLHQDHNGWADIGYHFLIDAAGNIYQGRPYLPDIPLAQKPTLAIGAHVGGANTGKIGVCLLGCFHPEANASTCNDVLTETVEASLVQLFAFLSDNYKIPVAHINGHRDFSGTACPGSNLHLRLPEIRQLVLTELSGEQPSDDWTLALQQASTNGASAVTAAQDRLQPGVAASHQMAQTDLQRVKDLKTIFLVSGQVFDVPPALLAALASRESRCGNVLAPDGTGDFGNGFGIMQVDKRFHTVVGGPRSQKHVDQAAEIFDDFRRQIAKKHPSWSDPDKLKGAMVAYNSGVRNVQTIARMDSGTTGNDYGSDVTARGQFYLENF